MILGFKPQFVPKIMAGTKIHSIREDSTRRWKAGMKIHMATGVRTKQYNCFKEDRCQSVQEIDIYTSTEYINGYFVKVGGRLLTFEETCQLAWNDGFENITEFYIWFTQDKKLSRALRLIHWTDFKY